MKLLVVPSKQREVNPNVLAVLAHQNEKSLLKQKLSSCLEFMGFFSLNAETVAVLFGHCWLRQQEEAGSSFSVGGGGPSTMCTLFRTLALLGCERTFN